MNDELKIINFIQDFGCVTLKQLQILFNRPNDNFKNILSSNIISKKNDIFVHNTATIDTEYITPKDSFDFSYLPTKNTLIFYKDGTMTYNSFRGTYTYSSKMKSLTFSFYRNNYEETYNFEVSNDLKKLTNTDKGKNQSTTNGELNQYYIEEYELK